MAQHVTAILAGGAGKRFNKFFPNNSIPKQFMPIFKGDYISPFSLINYATPNNKIFNNHRAWIISEEYLKFVAQEFNNIKLPLKNNFTILLEKEKLNTSFSVLFTALYFKYILKTNPNATISIFPSDQFFSPIVSLQKTLNKAIFLAKNNDTIVLLGIPHNQTNEHKSYGLIKCNKNTYLSKNNANLYYKVEQFIEKPQQMPEVKNNLFFLNAGIITSKIDYILHIYQKNYPELFNEIITNFKKNNFIHNNSKSNLVYVNNSSLTSLPQLSVDSLLLQNVQNMLLVEWKNNVWLDVGNYNSLYEYRKIMPNQFYHDDYLSSF